MTSWRHYVYFSMMSNDFLSLEEMSTYYFSGVIVEPSGQWSQKVIVFSVQGEIKLSKSGTWRMWGWLDALKSLRVTLMMWVRASQLQQGIIDPFASKRELGMGKIFLAYLWTESQGPLTHKVEEANIQPFWLNKLGQERIFYIEKNATFLHDTGSNPEQGR